MGPGPRHQPQGGLADGSGGRPNTWRKLGHGGSIVNVASILGLAERAGQLAAYSASKGGADQPHPGACHRAGRATDIRVNALAPGYVETDINRDFSERVPAADPVRKRIPQRRFGQPEDLDGALLLLVLRGFGRYMTGSGLGG